HPGRPGFCFVLGARWNRSLVLGSGCFFFNDTATTEIYTLPYTTLFRSALLNSLEISLYEHERVALMGPSGSGKSSIVHTLAGITEPTTGTIQILGRTIDHDNHSGRSYQS